MTMRQYLYLQRRSRPEQSDQRQPNQAANISHQPRASPNSTPLASRIEFPTMTRRIQPTKSLGSIACGLPPQVERSNALHASKFNSDVPATSTLRCIITSTAAGGSALEAVQLLIPPDPGNSNCSFGSLCAPDVCVVGGKFLGRTAK